ncbi:MAG: THUMP-like domain-containing protein [Hyphomicrobiales bacterium]
MDLARARYLASPNGRASLESLDPSLAALPATQLADRLRRQFPPSEAAALGEQLVLRAKARERFGSGRGLLASAPGLEMMTHPLVAARRAARLAAFGRPVVDLTAGLGGDLLASIEAGCDAVGVELDAPTALLANANTAGRVALGDGTRPPAHLARAAAVIDPARRGASGRRFDPAAFVPRWHVALELLASVAAGVMKAPPGIAHEQLPAGCETEFVQLGRSMREAAIWLGEGACPGLRRAVLLPGGHELTSLEPECDQAPVPLAAFVFDPESCVTRAGLVRQLGTRLGARLADQHLAYLTADAPAFDPLCATFGVLDVLPFSVRRLQQRLRERGWSPLEIRRRAFPVEPDELRRLLGRVEGETVTLLCATVAGERLVIIARRLASADKCEGV